MIPGGRTLCCLPFCFPFPTFLLPPAHSTRYVGTANQQAIDALAVMARTKLAHPQVLSSHAESAHICE